MSGVAMNRNVCLFMFLVLVVFRVFRAWCLGIVLFCSVLGVYALLCVQDGCLFGVLTAWVIGIVTKGPACQASYPPAIHLLH